MTHPNPWHQKTVAQMLDHSVARWGDKDAVVDGDVSLSFVDLQQQRDAVAHRLHGLGVRSGTHVGVFMKRSLDYVVLLHALWSRGAVVIPMNTTWESDEVGYALDHARVEMVFVGEESSGRDIGHVMTALGISPGQHSSSTHPHLREVVSESTISAWREAPIDEIALPHEHRQEGLMLFTSGTASRPKCVVLRQDGLMGTGYHYFTKMGVDQDDRFLSPGPYFHAGGLVQLLACNLKGATHFLFDGVNVTELVDAAITHELTVVVGFDPVLNRIFDEFERRQVPMTFRKVGCAPGTATYPRLEKMGIAPIMMYAMTEGGNMITLTDPAESELGRMSNGYPIDGIDVKIIDPSTAKDQEADMEGEICFRGWNLFAGYFGHEPGSHVDSDGYFHTGDFGWMDAEGRLYYRGRYSAMIKTGGENVSEAEVEHFLVTTIPSVLNAAVVGVPDPKWGEAVVAFVEVKEGLEVDEEGLREACRGKIAGYKIPKRFIGVERDSWPVTQTGKIIKPALREVAGAPQPESVGSSTLPERRI